jgi:hypothetical protein
MNCFGFTSPPEPPPSRGWTWTGTWVGDNPTVSITIPTVGDVSANDMEQCKDISVGNPTKNRLINSPASDQEIAKNLAMKALGDAIQNASYIAAYNLFLNLLSTSKFGEFQTQIGSTNPATPNVNIRDLENGTDETKAKNWLAGKMIMCSNDQTVHFRNVFFDISSVYTLSRNKITTGRIFQPFSDVKDADKSKIDLEVASALKVNNQLGILCLKAMLEIKTNPIHSLYSIVLARAKPREKPVIQYNKNIGSFEVGFKALVSNFIEFLNSKIGELQTNGKTLINSRQYDINSIINDIRTYRSFPFLVPRYVKGEKESGKETLKHIGYIVNKFPEDWINSIIPEASPEDPEVRNIERLKNALETLAIGEVPNLIQGGGEKRKFDVILNNNESVDYESARIPIIKVPKFNDDEDFKQQIETLYNEWNPPEPQVMGEDDITDEPPNEAQKKLKEYFFIANEEWLYFNEIFILKNIIDLNGELDYENARVGTGFKEPENPYTVYELIYNFTIWKLQKENIDTTLDETDLTNNLKSNLITFTNDSLKYIPRLDAPPDAVASTDVVSMEAGGIIQKGGDSYSLVLCPNSPPQVSSSSLVLSEEDANENIIKDVNDFICPYETAPLSEDMSSLTEYMVTSFVLNQLLRDSNGQNGQNLLAPTTSSLPSAPTTFLDVEEEEGVNTTGQNPEIAQSANTTGQNQGFAEGANDAGQNPEIAQGAYTTGTPPPGTPPPHHIENQQGEVNLETPPREYPDSQGATTTGWGTESQSVFGTPATGANPFQVGSQPAIVSNLQFGTPGTGSQTTVMEASSQEGSPANITGVKRSPPQTPERGGRKRKTKKHKRSKKPKKTKRNKKKIARKTKNSKRTLKNRKKRKARRTRKHK